MIQVIFLGFRWTPFKAGVLPLSLLMRSKKITPFLQNWGNSSIETAFRLIRLISSNHLNSFLFVFMLTVVMLTSLSVSSPLLTILAVLIFVVQTIRLVFFVCRSDCETPHFTDNFIFRIVLIPHKFVVIDLSWS